MRLEEDELLSELLESSSEHTFLAEVMGEPPTLSMPPRLNGSLSRGGSLMDAKAEVAAGGADAGVGSLGACWDEVLRLGHSRRELSAVVGRRLQRCGDQAKAALREAKSSDELRAALHGVGLAAGAAASAETERRGLEEESDALLARLGRPVVDVDDDSGQGRGRGDDAAGGGAAWVGSGQLVAARAGGQAEGRSGFRTTFLPPEDELDTAVAQFAQHHADFCAKWA